MSTIARDPTPSDLIQARLGDYIGSRFPGATLSDFRFLTSGWESDVYTFRLHRSGEPPKSFVLRVLTGDGAVEKLSREANGLRLLTIERYPVPTVLLSEADSTILGSPFAIVDRLEGRSLWPVLTEAAAPRVDNLLDRYAALIAQLHRLDWRPITGNAAAYASDPAVILDGMLSSLRLFYEEFDLHGFLAFVDWLETHKHEVAVQPAVVHLDFHANNVFVSDDDRLAVIDWTQITVSDFRADLTWTLMIMGDFGQRHWSDRLLRAYEATSGRPVDNLEYFNVITALKLLASTVVSVNSGPTKVGLRPETPDSIRRQAPILHELHKRIQNITGLRIPDVELALGKV